jgi:hypothetical protein
MAFFFEAFFFFFFFAMASSFRVRVDQRQGKICELCGLELPWARRPLPKTSMPQSGQAGNRKIEKTLIFPLLNGHSDCH